MRLFFFTLLCLLMLVACSNADQTGESAGSNQILITELTVMAPELTIGETDPAYPAITPQISGDSSAYPPPQVVENISPYPGNEVPTVMPIIIATAGPFVLPNLPQVSQDKGLVVGRIINAATNEPSFGAPVYLGDKLPLEPNGGFFISTQRNSSPHDEADEGGYFIITDVEPGTYALVLRTAVGSKVLTNPDTNDAYWVEVAPGETVKFENVYFELP